MQTAFAPNIVIQLFHIKTGEKGALEGTMVVALRRPPHVKYKKSTQERAARLSGRWDDHQPSSRLITFEIVS